MDPKTPPEKRIEHVVHFYLGHAAFSLDAYVFYNLADFPVLYLATVREMHLVVSMLTSIKRPIPLELLSLGQSSVRN
jgi:hypothetical protein